MLLSDHKPAEAQSYAYLTHGRRHIGVCECRAAPLGGSRPERELNGRQEKEDQQQRSLRWTKSASRKAFEWYSLGDIITVTRSRVDRVKFCAHRLRVHGGSGTCMGMGPRT